MMLTSLSAALALGAIGQQALPATGCAAYLWSASDRQLVAMAVADPARLRLMLDGKPVDLPRTAQHGEGGYGLAASTDYRVAPGGVAATLDLTFAAPGGLRDGTTIPQASLRLAAPGSDETVVPLAGIIGCAR